MMLFCVIFCNTIYIENFIFKLTEEYKILVEDTVNLLVVIKGEGLANHNA